MTVRSDVIALLDGVSALGQRNYADEAPEVETKPYSVVFDLVGEGVALRGDARVMARRRQLQVDLWQLAAEDDGSLAIAVEDALDGVAIGSGFHVTVNGMARSYDREFEMTRTVLTLETVRLRL